MKINIGPYRRDLIPVRSWERSYECFRSDSLYHEEEDWKWFDKAVYKTLDVLSYLSRPLNLWSNNRQRKIKIHIDDFDVWSMDNTLAMIVHPMLVRLRDQKHGSPCVDLEDVPWSLRPTDEPCAANGFVDNTVHERWAWVLDEMIWTFATLIDPEAGEDQFHHNLDQLEMNFVKIEGMPASTLEFNYQKDPAKPKYWVDKEGKKLHNERISNGLRLFAKYYRSLWD